MSSARPVNLWILAVGGLIVATLVLVLASGFGRNPRAVPSVLEQRPAPAFALQTLDGQTVDLASLRGKPIVINFWSTWCLPCKQEHPLLLKGPEVYPDVHWLGVLYSDDPVKARAYLKTAGSSYPQLVDPSGKVAIDYGVAGVPETYFIDANGTIVYKHVGPLTKPVIASRLDPLLGGP